MSLVLWRTAETPVGELRLVASAKGLCAVVWPTDTAARVSVVADLDVAEQADDVPLLNDAAAQLAEYFAGDRTTFTVPLDLRGTGFQRRAWRALADIPYGETRTYAQQAMAIDRPKAVRAIGAANGRNPLSIILPCHRVIGSDGSLTGFAAGLDAKRFLLSLEGWRDPQPPLPGMR